METLTIRKVIEQVREGQIRIPAFQRGFIWEPDRVAFLMDSIYKSYPYGALLFWRTNETLRVERNLGPFELPSPKEDYPIDYVLDGQQRITALYATFQTAEDIEQNEDWKDIYFDYSIDGDAQETQFFALLPAEVNSDQHFPLRAMFDTTAYRRATRNLREPLANQLDAVQAVFKEALIPVQMFRTDERGKVAVIFERINRQGVRLDTMQLLSAWTWSEDFQLQAQFQELADEFEEFGYATGEVDENLLLRCASAVLVTSPKPEAIVDISGEEIRRKFDEVLNGIRGALDFVRSNLGIQRLDNLPFQTILVPLCTFFAVSGDCEVKISADQKKTILRWFWKTCFGRRYSSGVLRYLQEDITSMLQLKGGQASNLGAVSVSISSEFFLKHRFGIRNVNTKTFILLLAQQSPRSFISGTPVDLREKLKEYNKTEFHHMVPKKHVDSLDASPVNSVNSLANFCFVSRAENRDLGGAAPSVYRAKMHDNVDAILRHAVASHVLFQDDLDAFLADRAKMLTEVAKELMA